ncbi:transcription factor TFIIIB component B'' homolog isoform X2 [Pseudorasbora parva]|uniref:transcription factor TFIIIB component B'' homolog isoform X2 n=1 Tax=Pseudorasbora parva TaxID=51549 RepID=UPI00351E47F1
MRRARISVKPNVRPGGRSAAEDKSSQKSTAADDTQQTPQSPLDVRESAVATGDGNVPGSPSEKASLNTNEGAPSSAIQPATTAFQRRTRFSATPNLARPKVHSAPPSSTEKTASLLSGPSKTSSLVQPVKSFSQSPVPVAISRDGSQNSTFSNATTEANCPPSSPCLPFTSGCPESPSSPSSPPSQQEPHHTPKKVLNEDFGPKEGATPVSCTLSPYVKLSRVDGPDSPLRNKVFSDKQQVLRALKLKELIKLERRKERMGKKSRRHKQEHCIELDRDKMSLADFIYYLPESNPMTSSLSTEETQAQTTAPSSPIVQKNLAEEDEDNDDADDSMLVPKVRVAEDGSLILDEESLTVRVQRTSDTVVENANPLFERGSSATYASFRKNKYVKSWSVRETDMFYLAISMVGTDFSMMAQLLTHRNRAEIKNKFRKEEKANAWRVDKAFRNKRPFDREFFSFLLKRILDKDKKKGKSIKLVVKSSKEKKGKGGKKAKQLEAEDSINYDDELCSVDSVCFDLEKENEDGCNVNEADVLQSTSKKRKRTNDTKPKVLSCEKTCKPRKKNKTPKKGKCSVEVEGSSGNADNEDQSQMPVSKKKRKQSKKGDQEAQEAKTDAKEKRQKKNKKKLIVRNEEPTDGEGYAENEKDNESPVQSKKRKYSKECAKEEERATKRKPKTKKSRTSKEVCTGSELGADGSEVSTAAPDAEEDQGKKLNLESTAQEEISQSSSKRLKRPVPNLAKRKAKKKSEPKATVETEDMVQEPQDECCKEAENEFNNIHLAEEQLQKQPVVVLERTPPRLKDSLRSSKSQVQPQSSQSPLLSPGRQARAEKVKRNLTASDEGSEVSTAGICAAGNQGEKLGLERTTKGEISQSSSKCFPGRQTRAAKANLTASEGVRMDQCQTGSDTSPEEMDSTSLPYQVVIQDTKEMEADQRVEEGQHLHNFELLTSSEANGQTLLKRPSVLVSHEEVEQYLRIQAQTAADESTASKGDHDNTRGVYSVGEHTDGLEEQDMSSVTLEESISQDPEVKKTSISSQQNASEKRRRFIKPTPSLSQAAQTFHRPLNVQTAEFRENTPSLKHDSTQLQCSSPLEVQVKIALNECHSEEESSITPEENGHWDVKVQDDARTTVDDLPSFESVDVTERRTKLEKSQSQISENENQITDREEYDSEPSEFDVIDTMIEEPQADVKRIVPVSGSSVCTQGIIAPVKHSQFAKPTSDLEWASQVKVNPQQTSEHNEDPPEKLEHQSPVKVQHCDLDQDIKRGSREDNLVVSEVDLQERKQDKDLMSPVLLLGSTQTSAPDVSVDSTSKGNEEQNDPVLSDASSTPFEAQSPVSSFYDPPSEHTSNMCDVDTMLFSESASKNIQISDEPYSENQDVTKERLEDPEGCIATLGNAKSEISGSGGVGTGATDNQSEEEPTFILTLYEIPTSQLFHEADCGQHDMPPFELQPAQIQTPSLVTGSSQSLSFTLEASGASLHMESEETKKQCESVSHKGLDDSLVPLSKDAAEDASTQLIASQESTCEDVNFLICPPEMLSCNSAMPTDVPKLDKIPAESPETKAPTQRRSKINVKPNLKPCVKVGPSNNDQLDCAPSQNLLTSHAKSQAKIESNPKTSVQEAVSPTIHLCYESGANLGYDDVISTAIVPGSKDMRDESQVKWGSPLRTGLQMYEDSVVDPPVHRMLADTFVQSSGEMEDDDNKEKDGPHDSELQIPEDLSVCLPESERSPSPVNFQENIADISKNPDTCREASSVTPLVSQEKTVPLQRRGRMQVKPKIPKPTTSTKDNFSRQEQTDIGSNEPAQIISPAHLIKEEFVKMEQRSEREDFPDIPKKELDTKHTQEVMKTKQQTPFTTVKTSACTESSPVELKIEVGHEDVSHVVLSDILVPVSMESGSPVQSSLPMREESQQALTAEADQKTHSHEGVSHMLLTDIFIPVCEDMPDDLSKQWVAGKTSPHEEEGSPMRKDPDNAGLLCAVSKSSNVGKSISPKRKRPTQGKGGVLLVKMSFPKRKAGDSTKSGEQSQTMPLSALMPKQEVDTSLNSSGNECISEPKVESAQCSFETFTCSDLLHIGSEDHEVTDGELSHMVPSDILVPVLDESAERILHKEAISVGLQDSAVKAEKSTDIERPANTETDKTTARPSVSVEWKTPCRRSTLHPKPKLSKKRDDPSETDLCQLGSSQTSSATPQQSLEPQAEEWSLKSNMLPIDSDEIENWCEGVSHMLLSDAFVPVSEEIGENSTDLKVFVSSSPHEDEEHSLSLPKSEEMPIEISDEGHELDTISNLPKIEESYESLPQAKKSPARSTFQMTLRSPERRLKDQTNVLKTPQAAPTTPQRAQTSKVKKSMGTPTKQHTGEVSGVCRVQLERLSIEEICTAQNVLEPKHHSTPVAVKTIMRGNEMPKVSLASHGSRSPGLESDADEGPPVPLGYSPKVVIHRIPITDANTSTSTSSPARVTTTASQPPVDHQFSSPPVSSLDTSKDPVEVSQFFLDDIFTEVMDPD